ncbi:hypothetical protein GCM10009846_10360 [Agrococcus versicolor]|uniref:DNA primase/polymerase bifunctional N-terminal domain-containing protein n=1 Tax=Agrococcus versicolor TaxID=501482 RepID=A0ABP5MDA3_9MICO
MTANLDRALALAERGWHVLPTKDKRPLVSAWQHLATTDAGQVSTWWVQWPDALPAVVPGMTGHVVVDIDRHEGKPDGMMSALQAGAPMGAQVEGTSLSGEGKHLWFCGDSPSAVGVLPGIDLRGVGGYVVVPYDLPPVAQVTQTLPDAYRRTPSSAGARQPIASSAEVQQWMASTGTGEPSARMRAYVAETPTPFRGRDVLHARIKHVVCLGAEGDPGAAWALQEMAERWVDAPHGEGPRLANDEFVNSLARHVRDWGDKAPLPEVTIVTSDEGSSDERAAQANPFPLLDLVALLDPERPARPWLWESIVPEGDHVSIVAAGGTGKSLLVLAFVVAVLRDEAEFLGRGIAAPGRVLYVDMENSEDDWAERLTDLGVTGPEAAAWAGRFYPLSLPRLAGLDTEAGAQQMRDLLDLYGVGEGDLLVLDSTQRVTEGEENSNDTVRRLYNLTSTELKRRGVTVIRTDNTGHGGDRARGASAKRDDVSAAWVLSKDDTSGVFTMHPMKRRAAGSTDDITFRRIDADDPDGPGRLTFVPSGSASTVGFGQRMDAARAALDAAQVPYTLGVRAAWAAVQGLTGGVPAGVTKRDVQRAQGDRKMLSNITIVSG